jgi:hypothetical protein
MKKTMRRIAVEVLCTALVSWLFAWLPAAAQTPDALPADKAAKIEAAIAALMSSKKIPGLSILGGHLKTGHTWSPQNRPMRTVAKGR